MCVHVRACACARAFAAHVRHRWSWKRSSSKRAIYLQSSSLGVRCVPPPHTCTPTTFRLARAHIGAAAQGSFGIVMMLALVLPLTSSLPGKDGDGIHEDAVCRRLLVCVCAGICALFGVHWQWCGSCGTPGQVDAAYLFVNEWTLAALVLLCAHCVNELAPGWCTTYNAHPVRHVTDEAHRTGHTT